MKRQGFFRRKRDVSILAVGSDWSRAIARLHADNFPRGWSTSDVEHLLEQKTVTALVACPVGNGGENDTAIGFCLVRQVGAGTDSEAEILSVGVEESWRKHGVGEGLLRETLLHLGRDRVESLFLEVAADNQAAIALYGKFGFTTVGERPGYYESVDRTAARITALIMRLTLVEPAHGD